MGHGPKYQFNVFERIKSVKEILAVVVPDKDSFRVRGLVMRCAKYQVGLIKVLSVEQRKAYDLLLKHRYSPKTVYEWLLLEDVPEHIHQKLVQNLISLSNARKQFVQWKRLSGTRAGQEIMSDIRSDVRRLRWKSQEGATQARS